MFFLNVLEESLIIIPIPIDVAPLLVANKAFLPDLRLPILSFNIFGFLLI